MSFGENQNINYGQPVNYLQDALLSGQVQGALQQRFDVNTAKLEELVSKVSAIPLMQEDAKKYLGERVQGALNLVNANLKASKGRGLLSNSVTTELNRYITSAIDDKVKTHMKYAQEIQNFETGVAKMKEKDPKSYNQDNYEFAKYQAGLSNYLNGTVDTKLGNLSYIPNKDVFGDLMKKAKEIKDLKGDEEIEVLGADGITKTKTKISGLKAEEVIKYFPELVTPQDEQQLMINGWADMKGMRPEDIARKYDEYAGAKQKSYEDEIADISTELNNDSGTLLPSKKETLENKLKIYQNQLENLKTSKIDKTKAEQVGYLFKKEALLNSAVGLFRGNISTTTEIDDVAKFKMEHELALDKHALDVAKAKKEGIGKGVDGTYADLSGVNVDSVSSQELADMGDKEFVKQFQDTHNRDYNTVVKGGVSLYTEITTPPDSKAKFKAEMAKYNYVFNDKINDFEVDPSFWGTPISKAGAIKQAIIASDLDEVYPEQVKNLLSADLRRETLSRALTESIVANKPKVPARYERVVTSGGGIGNISVTPTTQLVLTGGESEATTMANIRRTLSSKGLNIYVADQKKASFTGKTYRDVLEAVPQDAITGGVFDYDKPFTVKKQGENYIVTQATSQAKGEDRAVTAVVAKANTAFSSKIANFFTDENKEEISLENTPKNFTIKGFKPNKIVSGNDETESYLSDTSERIKKVIKDPSLVQDIYKVSSATMAKSYLEAQLGLGNASPTEASQIAELLVKEVESNRLQGQIRKGNSMFAYEFLRKGRILGDTTASVGRGSSLNSDIQTATMMYSGQMTLLYLSNYIKKNADRINTVAKAKQFLGIQ